MGKYLLQRNIIKFAIPVVAIPLAMGINYWATDSVARVARQVYRDKAALREKAEEIAESTHDHPLLALKVIYMIMRADKHTSEEESWLLNDITEKLQSTHEGAEAVELFKEVVDIRHEDIFEALANTSQEFRQSVYEAAVVAATADHKIQAEERPLLIRLAAVCGVEYNEAAIKARAKEGLV